jgi:predicted kinase
MTPSVYILCGIQFSGKSTLGRILAMQRGWTHVDVDAIAESLLDSSDSEVTEEQWTEAFTTSYEQIAASLARGQSVVHDATNYARTARDQVRSIAHQFGASAHVIYLAVPIDEADRRRIANQAWPQRHDVSDAGFWELVSSLEPPTADESVIVFDGTLDLATWIDRFICD